MGQKHSAKYSLTKKSANQRQSAQVGDEVAFSTDAPDRAPDEPVGVNISSQSNDYIGNAAQTMAKVWTERAVAESTEKDESKETGAEMKPDEERGEADEQSFAPVPSNTGPEEAEQQERQAQAENEKNQEEEGEDSPGTESEAQITLDEEKEEAEQISNNADEAEAENVAQQEVGEVVSVEAEDGQQDGEKQEQSEKAVADPVHAEALSVPSEEEGPVKGVGPDECKENVPLENGTPMDPSSFYQISSTAVETDESANGTVPDQCQQLNGEMVCCVGTGKPSEL